MPPKCYILMTWQYNLYKTSLKVQETYLLWITPKLDNR